MTKLTVHLCPLCVCVTVKIHFDNTSTYQYSSYSSSARLLCSIVRLGPPNSEILDPPLFTVEWIIVPKFKLALFYLNLFNLAIYILILLLCIHYSKRVHFVFCCFKD